METKLNNHSTFKLLLIVQTLGLVIYTTIAAKNFGWNLFDVYVGDILKLNWNGQFNLDFSCYLVLSAIWIMWRNHFSINAILYAIAAAIIGIMFFAPYLLYLLVIEKGNFKRVLIGNR